MLMVRAAKGASKVHGLGLIAQEFIPKGATVWQFQPGFDLLIPDRLFDLLSDAAKEQVLFYGYYDVEARMHVLSSDDDRFTNHSDGPNVGNVGPFRTIALRDIHPGEELTWRYGPNWSATGGGARWTGEEVDHGSL